VGLIAGLDVVVKRKNPLTVPTGNGTLVIQPVAKLICLFFLAISFQNVRFPSLYLG